MKTKMIDRIKNLLLTNNDYIAEDKTLLKAKVLSDVYETKAELLELLLSDKEVKELFFKDVNKILVFDKEKFVYLLESKEFLPDSYTRYINKIGLTYNDQFIAKDKSVVLSFPFKDCLLVGGQDNDDQKRKEIMFNEILANDQIRNLLAPKVFTNIKKYTKDGVLNNIDFNDEDNLIIKGNNLIVLACLLHRYENKVKCIYIDPPYNTGNDSFGYNDSFNHSTWLTFMKNRLELAKRLLREDGIIFVQCDDNEQGYLKVLMDEIFGRGNFITSFIWEKTQHFGRQKINYYSNADYIQTYSKNLFNENKVKQLLIENMKTEFQDAPLYNADNYENILTFHPEYCLTNIKDGEYTKSDNSNYELLDKIIIKDGLIKNSFRIKFKSRWSNETLQNECIKGTRIIFKTVDFSPRAVYYEGKKSYDSPRQIIFTNINNPLCTYAGDIKVGTNENATNEHLKLFGKEKFKYPKPESLMSYIIQISTQPNDLVLDFFLGSGTMAAVAHKMNRRYIGVEQMDYIEDITVERLKKVIGGEQGGISEKVNWNGGGELYLPWA